MDQLPTPDLGPPRQIRRVDDVETLKALSDPTRLAILRALMNGIDVAPRVMSAKELAEELAEPQTKLYRHIRHLEATGLVEVAQTRLVSGIVEQRYRAAQLDLELDAALFNRISSDDTSALIAAGFDSTRDEVLAAVRTGRLVPGQASAPDSPRPVLAMFDQSLPPAKARQLADRLRDLIDEFSQSGVTGGVSTRFFAAFYTLPER